MALLLSQLASLLSACLRVGFMGIVWSYGASQVCPAHLWDRDVARPTSPHSLGLDARLGGCYGIVCPEQFL